MNCFSIIFIKKFMMLFTVFHHHFVSILKSDLYPNFSHWLHSKFTLL